MHLATNSSARVCHLCWPQQGAGTAKGKQCGAHSSPPPRPRLQGALPQISAAAALSPVPRAGVCARLALHLGSLFFFS